MHDPTQHALKATAFEPEGHAFGEQVFPQTAKPSARRLAQFGAGLFWLAVMVILAGRLAYVMPAFGRGLAGAAGLLY